MPITIGTDCSGMEAPVQALRNLGVSYKHVFSCDIDKHARTTIEANFPHAVMYEDCTQRDNAKAPNCDVYVAGFPCQPFSMAGLQQGFKDVRGRGKVFFYVRDYIDKQRPKVFVLENVAGLRNINKGDYLRSIIKSLEQLNAYNVQYEVLNTKQHGVPHARPRIYIVGVRKDVDCGTFEYPEPISCPSIEKFLERRPDAKVVAAGAPVATQTTAVKNVKLTLRKLKREGSDPLNDCFIIDCDSTVKRSGYQHRVSPCITCGRRAGHWVTNRGRRLLKTEMMRLQGMDPRTFRVAVSEQQLGRQLGNTMSVNVVERLFCRLLPAAGLVGQRKLADRWEDGSAVRALAATRSAKFAASFCAPPRLKRKAEGASAVAKRARRTR